MREFARFVRLWIFRGLLRFAATLTMIFIFGLLWLVVLQFIWDGYTMTR